MKVGKISQALFLSIAMFCSYANTSANDSLLAENVADSYLRALTVGNIENALSFLDDSFLQERRTLLENPVYAQQLIDTYNGAFYEIIDSQFTISGNVLVNSKITLPNNDEVFVQFVMKPTSPDGFRIVSEN